MEIVDLVDRMDTIRQEPDLKMDHMDRMDTDEKHGQTRAKEKRGNGVWQE